MLKRRLLKFAAVAALAMAAGSVLNAAQRSGRTVRVTYTAPPGPLEVTLRDAGGQMLRRTTFEASAFRAHEIGLPEGTLDVEMRIGAESRHLEAHVAAETHGLDLNWGRQGP